MLRIERRIRAAINPVSTTVTRWWCHSSWRHALTGYGPVPRKRQVIRHETVRQTGRVPSAAGMKERVAAIDELLAQDDRRTG